MEPIIVLILLLSLHVLLAALVTVHVLLTKRSALASASWIVICWLRPITGSILYWLFGINRVRRRALKLRAEASPESGHNKFIANATNAQYCSVPTRVEGHLESLARMVGSLTNRPLLEGDRIEMFNSGEQVYPAMVKAIDTAEQTVFLSSYIFKADDEGQKIIQALVRAHARGARVFVLVDGVGSGYFDCPVLKVLKNYGIECSRFMHFFQPWKMPFLNLRNHRKILVVDEKIGFWGGINIASENVLGHETQFGRGFASELVRDTHFKIEGPVVRQMADAFESDWTFATDKHLPRFWPETAKPSFVTHQTRIITSGPDADLEKIEYTFLEAISVAKKTVCIMTPYFLPDTRLMTALILAAMRGVKVRILCQNPSNHPWMDHARDGGLPALIEAGCEIYMLGGAFNHSKLMTVDGEWSCVGSANWDMRSLRLNFEINMEIYGGLFARDLDVYMDKVRGKTAPLTKKWKLSIPQKLRNNAIRLLLPYL